MTYMTMVRHACGRCGKQQPAERMVYSKWTRQRYCADLTACAKRARRSVAA